MKYVRQNLSFLPRVVQRWHRFPGRLGKLPSLRFMTTSSSFAVCYEQGVWVETSSDLFPCKSCCDTPLGFPSLSPTGEGRIILLARSVDQGKAVGSQAREWLKAYQCLRSAVRLFLCPYPRPQFPPFVLDLSVRRLPVQTLALCTNGSRIGFAVSRESLETQNQKGILGSLWARCQLLSFANLVNSILMIFFCPCYAPCPSAFWKLLSAPSPIHFHLSWSCVTEALAWSTRGCLTSAMSSCTGHEKILFLIA